MSLDEPKPVDSVLTFPSGYDTLEYSWVKATAVSVRLRILFVTLQSTNKDPGAHAERGAFRRHGLVVERSHRVLLTMIGESPTVGASCQCFTVGFSEGYPEESGYE